MNQKNLESKIFTCSAQEFLLFNTQYQISELELIGVQVTKKTGANHANDIGKVLYEELSKVMEEKGYKAVTDVRITQGYVRDNNGDKWIGTIYGTAIKKN